MVDNSFSKGNRLRGGNDFSRVYGKGQRHESDDFVFYLLRSEGEKPRIGIVTPKSLGTAVERNRIKRIIRESFRKNKGVFGELDFIVKPKQQATELDNQELGRRLIKDFPDHEKGGKNGEHEG